MVHRPYPSGASTLTKTLEQRMCPFPVQTSSHRAPEKGRPAGQTRCPEGNCNYPPRPASRSRPPRTPGPQHTVCTFSKDYFDESLNQTSRPPDTPVKVGTDGLKRFSSTVTLHPSGTIRGVVTPGVFPTSSSEREESESPSRRRSTDDLGRFFLFSSSPGRDPHPVSKTWET